MTRLLLIAAVLVAMTGCKKKHAGIYCAYEGMGGNVYFTRAFIPDRCVLHGREWKSKWTPSMGKGER